MADDVKEPEVAPDVNLDPGVTSSVVAPSHLVPGSGDLHLRRSYPVNRLLKRLLALADVLVGGPARLCAVWGLFARVSPGGYVYS